MSLHKSLTLADIHAVHTWSVADAAVLGALVVVAADVGKIAAKIDDATFWILAQQTPSVVWKSMTPTAGFANPMTTPYDIIRGGTSGIATRMALGVYGQTPTVDSAGTAFAWQYQTARVLNNNNTSYNFAMTDNGAYTRFTNAAAKTATVVPNATIAYLADTEFHIRNVGTANLTLSGGAGVTVTPPASGTLIMTIGMTATLKRVGTDAWELFGQTT